MTDRVILTKLIKYYEDSIKEIKELPKGFKNYIENKRLEYGICNTAALIFNEWRLPWKKWVGDYTMKKGKLAEFWYLTPKTARNKIEILDRLDYRLKLMKKIIKKIK